jgi:hypothetical protein
MTPHPTPWTMETVTAGPARFYHEIAVAGELLGHLALILPAILEMSIFPPDL